MLKRFIEGSSSAALLEAQVPVVETNTCREQYQRVRNAVVDDRVLCAGYAQGGKDACQVSYTRVLRITTFFMAIDRQLNQHRLCFYRVTVGGH